MQRAQLTSATRGLSLAVLIASFTWLSCGGARATKMSMPADYRSSPSVDYAEAESGEAESGDADGDAPAAMPAVRSPVPRPAPARPAPSRQVKQMAYKPAPPPPPAKAVAPVREVEANRDQYDRIKENDFRTVADHPLSTFSIDVDTASYSNMRRFLREGRLPPAGAVRIEEMINYFDYDYPQPRGEQPFAVITEVGPAPWARDHKLVHIGLQGRVLSERQIPPRNLVFLLDVSGSMNSRDKLGLLKRAFSMLTSRLNERDRVSIVVYAGAAGAVLSPTPGSDKATILAALNRLNAGGSTNGGQGIQLAYALAAKNFRRNAINRVILATDGDFNVGTSDQSSLIRLIEDKRKSGVFLSVLGFGRGNLNDSMMEKVANHGNGNYAYIDSIAEAEKVLVKEAGSTLVTIAKDVKIQVEFNPSEIGSYRLVGYENRVMKNSDFNDDKKDAGEIGAGHTVTAIYEVVPAAVHAARAKVDALKYQSGRKLSAASASGEFMTVKLRYKRPDGHKSKLTSVTVKRSNRNLDATSNNYRFSAAVAGFGMLLRKSQHAGNMNFSGVRALAAGALGRDKDGWRKEMLELIDRASALMGDTKMLAN